VKDSTLENKGETLCPMNRMTETENMNESQLVRAIKAHIEKGDKAKDKAEHHYITAGLDLKTLKANHGRTWGDRKAAAKKISPPIGGEDADDPEASAEAMKTRFAADEDGDAAKSRRLTKKERSALIEAEG
jgi:hypothetical protein